MALPNAAALCAALDQAADSGGEEYVVDIIQRELMSDEQWQALAKLRANVYDLLNGRIEEKPGEPDPFQSFFDDWNEKLGRREFGF